MIVSTAGGAPTLALETGAADREADYLERSDSSALTFRYVVQAGIRPGTWTMSAERVAPERGAIEDAAGNGATLTLPAPGSPCSLGGSKAIVVDTTAPTVVATVIQGSGAPGHLRPGDIYLLYADVADAGSGVDGVVADLSAITAEATGVPLTSAGGPWSVGGITYSHRSDQQTADTSLEGVVDYAVNATDAAGNTTALSSNGSVAVDSPGANGGTCSRISHTFAVALSAGAIPTAGRGGADGGFRCRRRPRPTGPRGCDAASGSTRAVYGSGLGWGSSARRPAAGPRTCKVLLSWSVAPIMADRPPDSGASRAATPHDIASSLPSTEVVRQKAGEAACIDGSMGRRPSWPISAPAPSRRRYRPPSPAAWVASSPTSLRAVTPTPPHGMLLPGQQTLDIDSR